VTIFGTLPGLFIGVGASLVLLVYRASRPYVATLGRTPGPGGAYRDIGRHEDAVPLDDIVVLRIESGLYFANAENVRVRILDAADGAHAVILDAETTPFVDVSAARMLVSAHEELGARGVRLVLARSVGQVRDVLRCIADDDDLTK
jgi:sulfate permease, SulP family